MSIDKKYTNMLATVVLMIAISSVVQALRGGGMVIPDHHVTEIAFRAYYSFLAVVDLTIAIGVWRRKKIALLVLAMEQIFLVFFCFGNLALTKQSTLITYNWPPQTYSFIYWCGALLSATFTIFALWLYRTMDA